MAEVCFYLKKPNADGTSLIYLQKKYGGERLVYSFDQTINPKNWDKKKQRVKSKIETTINGKYYLNDLLDALRDECQIAYNKEIKSGVLPPAVLKEYLENCYNRNYKESLEKAAGAASKDERDKSSFYNLIESFIRGDIKHKGKDKSGDTIKQYKAAYCHILQYE